MLVVLFVLALIVGVQALCLMFGAWVMKIEGATFWNAAGIAVVGTLFAALANALLVKWLAVAYPFDAMLKIVVSLGVMAGVMMVLFEAKFLRSLGAVTIAAIIGAALSWALESMTAV